MTSITTKSRAFQKFAIRFGELRDHELGKHHPNPLIPSHFASECCICLCRQTLYLEQVAFCDALAAASALPRTTDTRRGVGRRGHSRWRGGGSSPLHRHCSTPTRSLLVPRALICNKQASSLENPCHGWSNLALHFHHPLWWRTNAKQIWGLRYPRTWGRNQRLGGPGWLHLPFWVVQEDILFLDYDGVSDVLWNVGTLHSNRLGVIPHKTRIFSTTVRTRSLIHLKICSCWQW